MIILIQLFFLPLYTAVLSLILIIVCLNSTKLRKKYSIDSLIIYMMLYLLNFLVDSIVFNILPYYSLQILHTLLMVLIISQFSNKQIVGLTGGIACGKTTATNIIRESLKMDVIDCDILARNVVKPGRPAYQQIVTIFGQGILMNKEPGAEIDRLKLGDLVFKDKNLRKKLTRVTSFYIFLEILKELYRVFFQEKKRDVLLDAPILFESGYLQYFCYPIILVYVTEENIQIKRMKERNGFDEEQARDRIKSQMKIQEKIKKSDILLNNEGTIEDLNSQIMKNLPMFLI